MSVVNIKIDSKTIEELKRITGEVTGHKAAETALADFIRQAKRRSIIDVLQSVEFDEGFDPLALRYSDR